MYFKSVNGLSLVTWLPLARGRITDDNRICLHRSLSDRLISISNVYKARMRSVNQSGFSSLPVV